MGRRTTKTIPEELRRVEAVRLRTAGMSLDDIGRELGGVTRQRAWQLVQEGLADVKSEAAEELRLLESERLDEMFRVAWTQMHTDHVTLYKGAPVMVTVAGENGIPHDIPLVNHGPKLDALDRLLRIAERRAKLFGLDAPVSVNVSMDALAEELRTIATALGLDPDSLNAEMETFLAEVLSNAGSTEG
jgi:hypothetical protein